jgi:hypothetical protein
MRGRTKAGPVRPATGLRRHLPEISDIMRHILLHGHIFKNAGTTFDWSLERSLGNDFLDHRDDKLMRERGREHLATIIDERPTLRALSSHFLCFPFPDRADLQYHPVFFLRHPIERFRSVYAFERRQEADTRGARMAKEKSFADYVEWRLRDNVPRTIRNYQLSNLTGQHNYPPSGPVPPRWREIARRRMEETACVGVVDRYDESMVVFEAALEEHFPHLDLAYIRQNITQIDAAAQIDERVEQTLAELGPLADEALAANALDLELYEAANGKLDAALGRLADREQRLEAFRARCERLRNPVARARARRRWWPW